MPRAVPDAEILFYNSVTDLITALKTDKIDGFPGDEPVLRLMSAEDPDLVLKEEYMDNFDFGAVFPKTDKGDALRAEMDEYFTKIRQSGELEEITYKWIKGPDSEKTVPDNSAFAAVQDLTKMGDIVRSRTYEAFFPLIAVTVIYFVLEGIIGALVDRLEILINPKRRKRDSILKGVKADD